MTKVQTHCMQVAKQKGNKILAVKLALLSSVESGGQVYLPNAKQKVEGFVSANEFAGYLSVLQKEGFYRSQGDGFFGEVVKQKVD